jgi:hypothetical protein
LKQKIINKTMLYPDDERAVTNRDYSYTTATVVAWEEDGELGISMQELKDKKPELLQDLVLARESICQLGSLYINVTGMFMPMKRIYHKLIILPLVF